MKSKSEQYLENRKLPPLVSKNMVKQVSEYRRGILEGEVEKGIFRDGATNTGLKEQLTPASVAGYISSGIKKTAQLSTVSGSSTNQPWSGGTGNTLRQAPAMFSPLWLNSNLNLPRDRATINAWCRSYFALNPIVQNAINLHSTYPISKLTIKCPNKKIEQFFNQMCEEIDLMNICVQAAQEYWLLGEVFLYAELDQRQAKWSRIVIQNPDYMVVQRTAIASEPQIFIRPDENLRRIVFSNKPSDVAQRGKINQTIIERVRRGENIPLESLYVSHLARRISPYEVRGTGLPVCIFRQLMLFDLIREAKYAQCENMINPITLIKLGGDGDYKPTHQDIEYWKNIFACHDDETEVLTNNGFKKFSEIIDKTDEVLCEGENAKKFKSSVKPGIKVACFDPNSEQMLFCEPLDSHVSEYKGEMYHFANTKLDICVTPNHKLYLSKMEYEYNGHRNLRKNYWGEWQKIEAQDVDMNKIFRTRAQVKWEGNDIKNVEVCGKNVPIELYLEYLGYVLSEGSVFISGTAHIVSICQTFEKYQKEMKDCLVKFTEILGKSFYERVSHLQGKEKYRKSALWDGNICNKEVYEHFHSQISDENGNCHAPNKRIPRWILELKPELLKIILDALVKGDGSVRTKGKYPSYSYYSTSKQLADDVYEIVYKCGYVPTVFIMDDEKYTDNGRRLPLYTVQWSESNVGKTPNIYKEFKNSVTKEKTQLLNKIKYDGNVWCLTVPTGLLITRRNGKITIQSNSAQYDLDYKIITHSGVTIEKIGSGQGIYDTSGDITQLVKEMYTGLMVPSVVIDGGGDISYANGGISLDVLRQKYMQFRTMLSNWLRMRIFSPIAKLNDFYEYVDGEKKLIIPNVEFNRMTLFDTSDYINTLVQLSSDQANKKISLQTLYHSLGLEYEDERRKIRKEDITEAIRKKEQMSLERMALNELRTISDDDEIPELVEPINGQASPYAQGGGTSGSPSGGDMGLGNLPGMSSPPGGGLDLGSPPPPSSPPGGAPPK